jgi:SHS2 domain-containing protein
MSQHKGESNRLRKVEELLNDPLYAQIPSDPQPYEIVEILSKNPAIVSYIGNILTDLDLHISNTKFIIKKKNRELDSNKSEIRLGSIKSYRNKLEECLKTEIDGIKELMQTGYTRTEAKEIVRLRRPEKPREADLSDKAEYLTRNFVIEEIEPLEEQLVQLQKKYDDWKVKYNLFDSNFKASQSIKGLIQRDRDNY